MNRPRLHFSIFMLHFSFAALCAAPAYALRDDRDRPLQVNAASVHMDEKTGMTVYRGNVVLVQGSLRIEADRLEVRTRGLQLDTVTAIGRPVRLRALLDNRSDELKANAGRLVYNANARALEMSGNVLLRQGGDQFSAEYVRYTLDGQRLVAHGSDAGDGRVHAVIQPRAKNSP